MRVISCHPIHKARPQPGPLPPGGLSLAELSARGMHHGANRFINPFSGKTKGHFWPVLKWRLFSKNRFRADYGSQRVVPVAIDWQSLDGGAGPTITFIKHATVMIRDGGRSLLVDPVLSDMFPLIQDYSPLRFSVREMPRPDHILITHGHYDHLNTATLSALGRDIHVISPLGYDALFRKLGTLRRSRLDWFDTWIGHGFRVTLLPGNHWSMRNPLIGPNTGLWGAYLLRTPSGAVIYISGDTGYFDGFKEIGEMDAIDLAIFNLGAYEPRWFMASSHLNPAETVRAFEALGAKRLMIVHWGAFRLGDEPVFLPPRDIARAMSEAGLGDRLLACAPGQSVRL